MLLRRFGWLLCAIGLTSCAHESPPFSPPAAEFLFVSGDSTYWVLSGPHGMRVRGSPIELARYGGRFHEIYLADDDHSYYDALMVGETIYSRDLIANDSTQVFSDTLVDRVADAYAQAHPDDEPLGPDDPVADRPRVVATSDISLLDVHGPYLSIEYHADTRVRPHPGFHTTWRRVVDMRLGHPVGLESLVGSAAADRVIADGRKIYRTSLDSARESTPDLRDIVDLVMAEVSFDPRSFTLTDIGGRPAVSFAGRIAGRRDGQGALPLPPIAIDSTAWWGEVRPTLPTQRSDSTVEWVRPGYTVVAHIDAVDSVANVTVEDTLRHTYAVATVQLPVRRVFWLDRPPIDSATRRALRRAFNEAAFYGDNVRVASRHGAAYGPRLLPAALVRSNPRPDARRPARRRSSHP